MLKLKPIFKAITLKEAKAWVFFALGAFVLGLARLAPGVNPLGVALLCAAPKRGRLGVFVGALAAALFDSFLPLGLFCPIFIYFVLCAKEKEGGAGLPARYLLAFSAGILRGAYIAVCGISDINGIFCLLAALIAYPAFTFAFFGYFDKKKELRTKRYELSLFAFAFGLTLVFRPLSVGGVSLSLFAGALFTLCAARTKGFAFGAVSGIVCGLVSGGAATGALGVLGMTYGLLANELEPAALALSFMLSFSGYFYLSGSESALGALLLLALAFCAFVPFRKKLKIHRAEASNTAKRARDKKLSRYAAAFSSLSSLFYTVSRNSKAQSVSELNGEIVHTVKSFCTCCKGCGLQEGELSNHLTTEIKTHGVANYSRLPRHIVSACPNAHSIARAVNLLPVIKESNSEKGLKQMADEYSAFSSLLIDAANKQESDSKNDKPLAEAIKSALRSAGVRCDGVRVVGTRLREITLYGVQPDKLSISPNELTALVSAQTKTALSAPELLLHEDYTLMRFKTKAAIRVECAKLSEAKSGETVCGDTVSGFENGDQCFYCLVSDGMGSGRDAALTSRLSAIMLEKLLSVGAEKESALKLLNRALANQQEEVFATVDLLELDRITSTATLIKAGAAPTLLIRGGKITKLEAKTPPAGIMKRVIADKKTFHVEKNDLIVMLSDGVLQTGSPFELLPAESLANLNNPRALASRLLRAARQAAEASDDMSVCVLRIY